MAEEMNQRRIGLVPPEYRFFLNPYRDMRFVAACPGCGHKPRQRKLPLAIHMHNWGMVVLNKTCRFCPRCDLLIAHEDELRELIDRMMTEIQSDLIGKPFFVVGTVERKAWRQGTIKPLDTNETLAALHDFIDYDHYKVVGGWQPIESKQSSLSNASNRT